MTVHDMIERAEAMVEENYKIDIWYNWIDEVLHDLTPMAKVLSEVTVNLTIADEEAEIDLDKDITDLHEVVNVSFKPTNKRKQKLRKLPGYDSVSLGWVHYNNVLKLQNLTHTTGQAVVEYYAELTRTESTVNTDDYTVNLPEKYHDIVVKGLCALAMQKEEEFDRKNDFYGEYTLGKRRMIAERTMAMEPWNAMAMRGGEGQ